MEPTAEQIESYEGKCALCKFFRGAWQRSPRPDTSGLWIDDEGWCVRYPPVFVGGEKTNDEECDTGRYKQPGVWGHDECGEYVRTLDVPNAKSEPTRAALSREVGSTDGFGGTRETR